MFTITEYLEHPKKMNTGIFSEVPKIP